MKNLSIFGFLISMLFAGNVSAQEYYEIYEVSTSEVQNKMNENKIAGINILTNIEANHIIGISGVSVSQKSTLTNLFTTDSNVFSVVVSDDVTSVILNAESSYKNNEIQLVLDQVNGVVTGHTIEYSVSEQ